MKLETPRLVLRDFIEDDWRDVLAYQSDPRYLRLYEWTGRDEAGVRAFVHTFLDYQRQVPRTKWQLALTLRGSDRVIGNCGIRMDHAGAHQADIGYELHPDYWGNGYATEAARAVVAFGFTQLRLHRIWSWCVADNTASANVLRKLGMREEGRLRDDEFYKGRYWDTIMFAILEDQWRQSENLAS